MDGRRRVAPGKDARKRTANLTKEPDARGGLRHPAIGEEGRRFLGDLLSALSDEQLWALFTAARADRRGGGVDAWVAAFREKRDAVLRPVPGDPAFRCPR